MADLSAVTRLAAKMSALVALLGSVVWFAKDPSWESGAAVIASLAGFASLEVIDQKLLRGHPERLAHDRNLFDRFQTLLPEQGVRDELETSLFNNETSRTFVGKMDAFHRLAATEAGDFLDTTVCSVTTANTGTAPTGT